MDKLSTSRQSWPQRAESARSSRVCLRCAALALLAVLLGACSLTPQAPAQPTQPPPGPLPQVTPTPLPAGPPTPLSSSQHGTWPVNILLLGADRRESGLGACNTDSILIVSLNPDQKRLALLSVPRDLWVDVPGHGSNRVNTAYAYGELDDTTSGLELARQTVSQTLGIPIHHAALFNFQAFVAFVDAIGGIDVDVPYAIADPDYPDSAYGYDPFYINAGLQHLDGETALKYARTRATSGGDFGRTERQRQVALAIRDRVTQPEMLQSVIASAPALWGQLQGAIETNLSLSQIIELGVRAAAVPRDNIALSTIDDQYVYDWVTPEGWQVLMPRQDQIAALVEAFNNGTTAEPSN